MNNPATAKPPNVKTQFLAPSFEITGTIVLGLGFAVTVTFLPPDPGVVTVAGTLEDKVIAPVPVGAQGHELFCVIPVLGVKLLESGPLQKPLLQVLNAHWELDWQEA